MADTATKALPKTPKTPKTGGGGGDDDKNGGSPISKAKKTAEGAASKVTSVGQKKAKQSSKTPSQSKRSQAGDEDENELNNGAEDEADDSEEQTERDPTELVEESTDQVKQTASKPKDAAERITSDAEKQGASQQNLDRIPPGTFNDAIDKDVDGPDVPDVDPAQLKGPFKISEDGEVLDANAKKIGSIDAEAKEAKSLLGTEVNKLDSSGNLLDKDGDILSKIDLLPKDQLPSMEELTGKAEEGKDKVEEGVDDAKASATSPGEFQGPFKVGDDGNVMDASDQRIGSVDSEAKETKDLLGKEFEKLDSEGNLLDKDGGVLAKVDLLPKDQLPDTGSLAKTAEGAKENVEGEASEATDAAFDAAKLQGPFQVSKEGEVTDANARKIGSIDPKAKESRDLLGKEFDKLDSEGNLLDKDGSVLSKIELLPQDQLPQPEDAKETTDEARERAEESKEGEENDGGEDADHEETTPVDCSILAGKRVNKAGNILDDRKTVVGRIVSGTLKHLINKTVDKDGLIWNDQGKTIGRAEPIPEDEKEDYQDPAPFEDFPDATVQSNGDVVSGGEKIGRLVEGDPKKLKGKQVDPDGDVLSRTGDVLGKAERWEAPDEEPEPETDLSSLAGKRVNKKGLLVDQSGAIYGRLIEGDPKTLAGRMSDKLGCIRSESGDIIGKAELVPESEREGQKDGPFADFDGCKINKDSLVETSSGQVVGRLKEGDAKKLQGKAVDADGDVLDSNGNVLGKAERWEEEEAAKDVNPMAGRKVNKKGEVCDENGDVIGRLTDGDLGVCAGKQIDEDGDVLSGKGATIGHVTLLADIPDPEPEQPAEPEPEESEEEKAERQQREQDRKLAAQMGSVIEQSLDKIKPVLRMITQTIDKEERKPEKERDEEELVKQVKPMIEEGGRILTECNGAIRGMDPDGRIQANAKHKTAAGEASREEYHLADLLKELTGWVTETIENAKRKIEDMPHAKKEINPLWTLLTEPLGQILAAVGLLLAGVLGLVGKLLSGLGLGGILNNLLGGLGITNLLDGLGLGSVVGSLTGK